MPIFRRPSLDDRRRLVIYSQRLTEESVASIAAQTGAAREAKRNQAAYGSRVQRRLRARWYGLVPVKSRTLVGLAVVLLSVVGVLGLLHWASLWWAPIAEHPEIARPLRLDRADSFGTWFSAVVMVATAGASFLVYQLRRYKSDDYHGHYRIWRFAIVLSLICSVDCVIGLVSWLGGVVDVLLAERDFLAGADWVRLLLGFGGAAFALRMIGEVARNRAAAAVLGGSFICFALPLVMRWKLFEAEPATVALVVPIGSLLAKVGAMLAVVIYLRMLYREVRRLEASEPVVQRLKQFFVANRIFATEKGTDKEAADNSRGRSGRRARASETSDAAAGRQRKVSESAGGAAAGGAGTNRKVRGRGDAVAVVESEGLRESADAVGVAEGDKKEKVGFWKRFGRSKTAAGQAESPQDAASDSESSDPGKTSGGTATTEKPHDKGISRFSSLMKFGKRAVKQEEAESDNQSPAPKDLKSEEAKAAEVKSGQTKTNEDPATVVEKEKKPGLFSQLRGKQKESPDKQDAQDAKEVTAKPIRAAKTEEVAEKVGDADADGGSAKKAGWFSRFKKSKAPVEVNGEVEVKEVRGREGSGSGSQPKPTTATSSASTQPTTSNRGQNVPQGSVNVQAGTASRQAPPTAAASVQRAPATSDADDDDDDDGQDYGDEEDVDPDSIDWASLSKSERRRMRKVLKRQGKAA